jgi:hypothetical protein
MDAERLADRLGHILEAIDGIEGTIAGLSRETVMEHWTLRSAVERGIEIISEAARHVPSELTDAYPDVPWRKHPRSRQFPSARIRQDRTRYPLADRKRGRDPAESGGPSHARGTANTSGFG